MQRFLAGMFLVLVLPLAAVAQEFPKAEVFGGYSYFRADADGVGLNGWNGSVTGNLTSWLGVEGDVAGHYGSPKVFGFAVPFVDVNTYTVMGGPRVSFRSRSATPFAHFLVGAARAGTGAFDVSLSSSALAAAVGGGIDINVGKSIAIRAIQADYLMTRFDTAPQIFLSNYQDRQNNFRFSAGVVIKLGN